MFKKLQGLVQQLAQSKQFDPTVFDDPIAQQTEWTPLKGGGANFATHRMISDDPNLIEFRPSTGAYIFYTLFAVVGIGLLVGFGVFGLLFKGISPTIGIESIIPLIVGTVFTLASGYMLYTGTTPIFFDFIDGYFWKGRKHPSTVVDMTQLKDFCELRQIHAVQIIKEYVSSSKSSYNSFEINLVLKDGSRLNVVDHGSRKRIREDAEILANALGVPLWDPMAPPPMLGDLGV